MNTQLPIIKDKAFTPARNTKHGVPREIECDSNSCAQAKPHTHEQTTGNGAGWLERKASGEIIYHTPWLRPHKPFTMPLLKPRVETEAKGLARIRKAYVSDPGMATQLGRGTGGYGTIATNGHWALLERGKQTHFANPIDFLAPSRQHKAVRIVNPEFQLALKRADVMADELYRVVLMWGNRDSLTVYSEHKPDKYTVDKKGKRVEMPKGNDLGSFDETLVDGIEAEREWQIALNVDYIEPLLGTWPLTMWIKDAESNLVFEPADKSWRFVLMGIRVNDFDFAMAQKACACETACEVNANANAKWNESEVWG